MKQQHIVIVGGGYAGMICAIRLAGKSRRMKPQITLINGAYEFIERPRLPESATNMDVPHKSIRTLLDGTGVEFIQGWVTAINPDDKIVSYNDETIHYDYLVVAVGSKIKTDSIPGINDHAYVLHPYGDNSAEALSQQLQAYQSRDGKVIVIGSGATGIEGAGFIKSLYPHLDVTLVTAGAFATFKDERAEKHMRSGMDELGVHVIEHQPVKAIEAHQIVLVDGETLAFDICLWAGGFVVPSLARDAGLPCNDMNQVCVDACLHPQGYDDIYVVGDAMIPEVQPGAPSRMSVMVAMVSGAHTADNLSRRLRDKTEKPMSFAYYGQCVMMGAYDAVGGMTYPADQFIGPIYRGKFAVAMRNFFLQALGFFLVAEKYMPGAFIWMGRGRYRAQQRKLAKSGHAQQSFNKV